MRSSLIASRSTSLRETPALFLCPVLLTSLRAHVRASSGERGLLLAWPQTHRTLPAAHVLPQLDRVAAVAAAQTLQFGGFAILALDLRILAADPLAVFAF